MRWDNFYNILIFSFHYIINLFYYGRYSFRTGQTLKYVFTYQSKECCVKVMSEPHIIIWLMKLNNLWISITRPMHKFQNNINEFHLQLDVLNSFITGWHLDKSLRGIHWLGEVITKQAAEIWHDLGHIKHINHNPTSQHQRFLKSECLGH